MTAVSETTGRSVAKAVSWRLLGTVATAGLVFLLTSKVSLSIAVGGLEFFSKIGLYVIHERVWARIPLGRRRPAGAVVWFTGLSGAGKSTIADAVAAALRRGGAAVERLDGDAIRDLFPATGFSPTERREHLRRVGFAASRLEHHGIVVVASFVSPFADNRADIRRMCRRFVEVHVTTPLSVCEQRDVKGLYARARRGEIAGFTGIDQEYEPPTAPELQLDTTTATVEQSAGRVVDFLNLALRERSHGSFEPARVAQHPHHA